MFKLSTPVQSNSPVRYTSPSEATGSPIAEAVFGVGDICEVELQGDLVTVVRRDGGDWSALQEKLRYAVGVGAQRASGSVSTTVDSPATDDEMFDLVLDVFDREINPSVAQHGGRVELIDVQDATVIVRMQGGCQGCGMANVTLKQGIEGSLRRRFPSLRGVEDVTDHAAGTNPYFSSSKK